MLEICLSVPKLQLQLFKATTPLLRKVVQQCTRAVPADAIVNRWWCTDHWALPAGACTASESRVRQYRRQDTAMSYSPPEMGTGRSHESI